MVICPCLCTGNPLTWTSTCSGTVITTSQQNLVLITPSPIGPKQCVAILSFSAKKWITSGRQSPNVNSPKWALDKVEKRLNGPSREVTDWANNQGTAGTQPTINEVKPKGHIVIPYTQGLCESIKKICGRYGIQTHFKGGSTIKNLLVSLKVKDPMVNKSGVYTGSNVVTLPVMRNT